MKLLPFILLLPSCGQEAEPPGRVLHTLEAHQRPVAMWLSPDGSRYVVSLLAPRARWSHVTEAGFREEKVGAVVFSADGRRCAYLAGDGKGGTILYIDGKADGPARHAIRYDGMGFYGRDGDFWCETVIGGAQRHFRFGDKEVTGKVRVSATPLRVTWTLEEGKQTIVGLGREVVGTFELLRGVAFSADGRRFAVAFGMPGKAEVLFDGRTFGPYDRVSGVALTPDGAHAAWFALEEGKGWRLVVDGKAREGPAFTGHGALALSPDGKRHAFIGHLGRESGLYVDGVRVRDAGVLTGLRFDASGKRWWCFDQSGEKRLILDGKTVEGLEPFAVGDPVFTPDGSRVAMVARDGDGPVVWVDGKVAARGTMVKDVEVTFSPDGKRWGALVAESRTWAAVVEGSAQGEYEEVTPLRWTRDGKRWFFGARKGRTWTLVVDGKERGAFAKMSEPVALADGSIRFLAADERAVYEVTGKP